MLRINISLSQHELEALKEICDQTGMTMSEFTRRSIRFYKRVVTLRDEGLRIYSATREGAELREIEAS